MFSITERLRGEIKKKFTNFTNILFNQKIEDSVIQDNIIEKKILVSKEKLPKQEIFKKYTEYFFLPDNQLHDNFNFDRDLKKDFELYLCIYRVNTILPAPYLEYYFEGSNLEYSFPFKKISSDIFKDILQEKNGEKKIEPIEYNTTDIILQKKDKKDEKDKKDKKDEKNEDKAEKESDDDDEINNLFLNECYNFFKEKTNYNGNITDFKNIYRGFDFFKDENGIENNNKIYIVIDSTNIDIFKIKEIKQIWAITYEILILKKIFETYINKDIINIFEKSRILNNIKKYKDINNKNLGSEIINYPQLLYLCKKEEGYYTNIYYEESENAQNTKTLIFERVQHPILKDIYLFSKERLSSDIDFQRIKRFILFINPDNMVDRELTESNIPKEPIIGFKEIDKEFWCCKSPRFFVESGEY